MSHPVLPIRDSCGPRINKTALEDRTLKQNMKMRNGAFALIDCLGFKGSWGRMPNKNPKPIIDKFSRIRSEIDKAQLENQIPGFEKGFDNVEWKIILLSDSIALSVFVDDDKLKSHSLWILMKMISRIMAMYCIDFPQFVVRGCISYGEHLCWDNFLVGPAVDEAANHYELADGAFVWLLPSAEELLPSISEIAFAEAEKSIANGESYQNLTSISQLEEFWPIFGPSALLVDSYPMPIKQQGNLKSKLINPFWGVKGQENVDQMIRDYSVAMKGDKLDIRIKKQNTLEFIARAQLEHQSLGFLSIRLPKENGGA